MTLIRRLLAWFRRPEPEPMEYEPPVRTRIWSEFVSTERTDQ